MPLTASDLSSVAALLRDSGGVVVTKGAASTHGHLDTMDEDLMGDSRIMGVRFALTIETGALGVLANGDALVADGTTYEIRDHRRIGDGAMTLILLSNA